MLIVGFEAIFSMLLAGYSKIIELARSLISAFATQQLSEFGQAVELLKPIS